MKRLTLLTTFLAVNVLVAASDSPKKLADAPVNPAVNAPAKKSAAKKNSASKAQTVIPQGAVKTGDTYSFTDPQGVTTQYQRTPFGVVKLPQDRTAAAQQSQASSTVQTPFGTARTDANASAVPAADSPTTEITATEIGDSIRFERPSPFGKQAWTRKKSELSEDEKKMWDRQKQKQQ
jgi:hypothetical protein